MEKFEKHGSSLWDNIEGPGEKGRKGSLGLKFYYGNGFLLKGQNCKLMKAFSVSVDFLLNCIS